MSFNIFNVIESGRQRIVDVDDDDLPIRLAFVQQGHDTQNLDLLDLAWSGNKLPYFANVKWIVVSSCFCLCMFNIRILPSLADVQHS